MIKILSLRQVFVDGIASGPVALLAAARPDLAAELQSAVEAFHAAEVSAAAPELARQLRDVSDQVAVLRARLDEPLPALPAYYQIVALPVSLHGATHAGILQPPPIGGDWLVDLLFERAPGVYALVRAGDTIKAGDLAGFVTTVTDAVATAAEADIRVALAPLVAQTQLVEVASPEAAASPAVEVPASRS